MSYFRLREDINNKFTYTFTVDYTKIEFMVHSQEYDNKGNPFYKILIFNMQFKESIMKYFEYLYSEEEKEKVKNDIEEFVKYIMDVVFNYNKKRKCIIFNYSARVSLEFYNKFKEVFGFIFEKGDILPDLERIHLFVRMDIGNFDIRLNSIFRFKYLPIFDIPYKFQVKKYEWIYSYWKENKYTIFCNKEKIKDLNLNILKDGILNNIFDYFFTNELLSQYEYLKSWILKFSSFAKNTIEALNIDTSDDREYYKHYNFLYNLYFLCDKSINNDEKYYCKIYLKNKNNGKRKRIE